MTYLVSLIVVNSLAARWVLPNDHWCCLLGFTRPLIMTKSSWKLIFHCLVVFSFLFVLDENLLSNLIHSDRVSMPRTVEVLLMSTTFHHRAQCASKSWGECVDPSARENVSDVSAMTPLQCFQKKISLTSRTTMLVERLLPRCQTRHTPIQPWFDAQWNSSFLQSASDCLKSIKMLFCCQPGQKYLHQYFWQLSKTGAERTKNSRSNILCPSS